jgi:two-component system, chemotaxis family, sensor kinase CheA
VGGDNTINGLDPSILQDFLTESGELVERLEGDLVALERDPKDPEMLNQVFRALHTIKGSASFLALTNLVSVAHAAEGALNAARNRVVTVDRAVMDMLLQAVDLIKRQLGEIRDGVPLTAPARDLVEGLTAVGEGRSAAPSPASTPNAKPASAPAAADPDRLELPPGKADLLEFLVSDVEESLVKIAARLPEVGVDATRDAAAADLAEQCEALGRGVEFFEVEPLSALVRGLSAAVASFPALRGEQFAPVLPRCAALVTLIEKQATALKQKRIYRPNAATLLSRLATASEGHDGDGVSIPAGSSAADVLVLDGVESATNPSAPAVASTSAVPKAPEAPAPDKQAAEKAPERAEKPGDKVDQTIRVEVGRLESLMNLVGELVLQKNRIGALARGMDTGTPQQQAAREAMGVAAGGLDRVTSDLQVAVMRTRMQPLDKLFGRYPRLIRDLCAKTGKKMDLVIEGGETEVDKSVIEELNDPLVHLLRNSADHGIEPPDQRTASGKTDTGTLKLIASHEGSHVRILLKDDGRGLIREKIAAKAVERGLVDAAAVAGLSDRQVFDFIFLPGFSTAEKVSDLSGRGVGMDVVRTNVRKLKGEIELSSAAGRGTTVSITIPLTVAILPAMMVAVGPEVYAVPLGNILEIVRPENAQVSTIGGNKVMRLRDTVLPLVSAGSVLGRSGGAEEPFVVVLTAGEHRIGLLVTGLIGQQEVVVKPLDGAGDACRAVSGATVRDDGGVSLIVDVNEVFRLSKSAA